MGQSDTAATTPPVPAQGPAVFQAPPGGWSRDAYRSAVQAFTRARDRNPQTVIMHPETLEAVTYGVVRRGAEKVVDGMLAAVHREEQILERVRADMQHGDQLGIKIVTSDQHDRDTIVMT